MKILVIDVNCKMDVLVKDIFLFLYLDRKKVGSGIRYGMIDFKMLRV